MSMTEVVISGQPVITPSDTGATVDNSGGETVTISGGQGEPGKNGTGALPDATVATLDGTGAPGTASTYSRGDHKHAVTPAGIGADPAGAAATAEANAKAASDPVGTASAAVSAHDGAVDPHHGKFDASGAASAVSGNLTSHANATGASVHGLGTASTHAATDFDAAGTAATAESNAKAASDPIGSAATVAGNLSTHAGLTTTAHGGLVASTDPRLSDARTPTAHNQGADTITTGTLDGDRLPEMSATKAGAVPATGTPSGKVLSDGGTWVAQTGGGGNLTPKGAWTAGTTYAANDLVSYLGSSWIALQASTGQTPAEGVYWTLSASKGDDGDPGLNGAPGENGAPGTPGTLWYNGSGNPSPAIGDQSYVSYYLDTDTGNVWRRAGTWSQIGNIKGTAGTNGTNGTNGIDGTDGATWTTGTGEPSGGADGDLYLRTSNSDVYLRTGGTWAVICNIKGAAGSDATVNNANVAAVVHAASADALADADEVPWYQAIGGALKKSTWANIKAALFTYFSALFHREHGFENRTSSTLVWTDSSPARTLTITGTFSYFYQGAKVTIANTSPAVQIDNTVGIWYIYFASNGTLTASQNFPAFSTSVIVAIVAWNGTAGTVYDERHSSTRNLVWHGWAHSSIGCRYGSGIDLTTTGTGAAATFATTSGDIWDEDINFTVPASSAWTAAHSSRIWRQISASAYTFNTALSTTPFLWNSGTSRVQFVQSDHATPYSLVDCATNRYVNVWVYAANNINQPIKMLVETKAGATGYTSVAAARAVAPPNLKGLGLAPEMKILYRLVVQGDGIVQAAVAADDYRNASPLPAGGSASTSAAAVSYSPSTVLASATNVQAALDLIGTAATGTTGTSSGNIPTRPSTGALSADTISEITAAAGVTVDGLLIKDGAIAATAIPAATASVPGHATAAQITKLDGIASGATANAKATSAEVTAGSDDTKFVTASANRASVAYGRRYLTTCLTGTVSTGDAQYLWVIPESLNGWNLVRVNIGVKTAASTVATTVDLYNVTDSHDMLSTAVNMAVGAVLGDGGTIDTSYDDVATGDRIRLDITTAGTSGQKCVDMAVTLEFGKP